MELRLDRLIKLQSYCLGSLFIRREGDEEWTHACFSKEPGHRKDGLYIAGESCLPEGNYAVSLQQCKRFGQIVPLLTGPRLIGHGGNTYAMGMRILPGHHLADSESGILVGQTQGPSAVHHTRAAYQALVEKFESAISDGEAIECQII